MSATRTLGIGLCGLGTVGQGVWKHFGRLRSELESRLGARIELRRAAVRDLGKARAVKIARSRLTTDALAVATDPDIDIVCELMGGVDVARKVTLAALSRGKVVVSANKALICAHGAEIFATARRNGGHFLFEASVAGHGFHHVSHLVIAANRRGEEPEAGRLSHDQAEFLGGNIRLGPFLHPEGGNAEGLKGRLEAGNGGHG